MTGEAIMMFVIIGLGIAALAVFVVMSKVHPRFPSEEEQQRRRDANERLYY